METRPNRSKLYGGIVWMLSAVALLTYGYFGLTNTNVPGVEEFVDFVSSAEGVWIYAAAFLAIFFEGLYFIGSFFPGSTFVLLIAIVAQAGGTLQFLGVILTVFIGWIFAGLVNIYGARFFSKTMLKDAQKLQDIEDNAGMTWFPAFRANTEVAQIAEGHPKREVFLSSLRVKAYASVGAAVYALIIPFIIDIQELNNEEGFWGLSVIAAISFGVGVYKVWEYRTNKQPAA